MTVLILIKKISFSKKLMLKVSSTLLTLRMKIKTFRFLISYQILLVIKVSWASKKTEIKLRIRSVQLEIPILKINHKLNIIIRKLFIQLMKGKIINRQLNRILIFLSIKQCDRFQITIIRIRSNILLPRFRILSRLKNLKHILL